MFFSGINKIDLKDLIYNSEQIYAHIDKGRIETLEEHADLSLEYLYKIISKKKLGAILLNLEKKLARGLSEEGKKLFREMLLNAIHMHDVGKINCNFQYHKMKNKFFAGYTGLESNFSNHSMLSALIYMNHYYSKIREFPKVEKDILLTIMCLNAYVISKHHGNLDSFNDFRNKLVEGEGKRLYTQLLHLFSENYTAPMILNENLLGNIFEKSVFRHISQKEQEEKESSIYLYMYVKLISSLLLSCDYYATSQFKNLKEIKAFGEINDIGKFYDLFKKSEIYQGIGKYKAEHYGKMQNFGGIKDINILRNELFLEAEESLLKNIDKNIFYLEAPTGSGKSNVAFNLSFLLADKIPELNKIFYVYPFNTLIEQNLDTLKKTFASDNVIEELAVINSLVPIKAHKPIKDEDSDVMADDYEISLLDRQFLHYPIVLTTHISLFNYLFGVGKNDLFPLGQLANSVIILDEIQSYKNTIWKEIITFLHYYAEVLNIKVIIMSATLPNLNRLLHYEVETVNLIRDRDKYYGHPLFKNRVGLDFSLLEVTGDVEENLLDHVLQTAQENQENILIEFIKKKTAARFHKKLKSKYEEMNYEGREIELITGDDNSVERKRIIEKVKNHKNIILVATQVIEAGVDIDMDIGYKDIAMLDAEEQFLGRVNRSCLKNGNQVFFFNLDDPSMIYKMDIRKEKHISLLTPEMREILHNKNFIAYYSVVLGYLKESANKKNDDNFDDFVKKKIGGLDFAEIEKHMRLIDERYEYSIFLNRKVDRGDGQILEGKEVWNKYIDLLKNNDLGYAEKKVKLSMITSDLYYFIYKVRNNNFIYQDNIGDIYYIEDGEKYFTDGKFNREEFEKGYSDSML